MSDLHYASIAPARVYSALRAQALASLDPYRHFLRVAIEAAARRESLSQVRFELVAEPVSVTLEPQDSLFDLPPRARWFAVEGLDDAVVDVDQPLVVDNARLVPVEAVDRDAGECRVRPASAVDPQAAVFWCGRRVRLRSVDSPRALFDAEGHPVDVEPVGRAGEHARVIVRRTLASLHDEQGGLIATALPAATGATTLDGAQG